MNQTNGSKVEQKDGYVEEEMLFTYSEKEKQENEINAENAKRVFTPEYIPFYRSVQDIYSLTDKQTLIYGFIRYYTSSGSGKFYFTDAQLAQVVGCHENTAQEGISALKKCGLINVGHKVRAGGGTIRFVTKVKVPVQENLVFRVQENPVLRVQENLGTNKNKIKENKINTLSKDKGTKSDKRDVSVNRFIEGVNNNLDYKLPNDGQARRYAHNAIQLLTRTNAQGNTKEGREFLKEDVFENAQWFMTDYLNAKIERGFHPQKWGTLYDNLKLWIANEGRFPEDKLSKDANATQYAYRKYG